MRISDWSSDVCSSDLKLKRDVRIGVSVIISSNEHPKSSIGEDELTTQVMHAPRPRVHLMGGDGGGWALDDDLAQTRAALAGAIEEADQGTADILHYVWWVPLLYLPAAQLARKRDRKSDVEGTSVAVRG